MRPANSGSVSQAAIRGFGSLRGDQFKGNTHVRGDVGGGCDGSCYVASCVFFCVCH